METKIYRTIDDEIAYNNYKLTADKIYQLLSQIREDPSASAKRWVWELLQNAKDVPNRFGKVSVEIELVSKDTLKFRHNGDTFSTKNITGLVQQVSSKDSQNKEGQTGKFGTGFICTHLLSDIIDVEGIVTYMGINRRFQITLDRSGYRSEDLLPRIESTLEELRNIEKNYKVVDDYENNRKEDSFDTVFTYHLTTEEKQKSAVAGLNDLINTMPVTLVTQANKIKEVTVIDRTKGTRVEYTCHSEDLGNHVKKSIVTIDNTTKTYLSYITEDVALTTEVTFENGQYKIVKHDSKQPVLYRDFPLIGSEKFFFPFILNGFNFNPTERRNGLLLNSADHPNSIANREIVEKAVEAALKFNEWLITNNVTDRYLLASSRIPESPEKYSEDVAAPWIKTLQLKWRKQLLDEKLVETDNGIEPLKNLSTPSFSPNATKEVNEAFYHLLSGQYIGRGVLPKFSHLHGWLDIVRPEYDTWGTKLKYDKEDFLTDLSNIQSLSALSSKIGKSISEALSWLNSVYEFLEDQNMLKEFDNYAIIPNQKGEFKYLKDLKSDHSSRIPEILKNIYNSVNDDNASIQQTLMDASIDATIFGNTLQPFSLKEMIDTLNQYVRNGSSLNKNGKYVDIKSTVAYSLIALYPNIEDNGFVQKRKTIHNFCKAYRQMDDFYQVDVSETDLWKETDNFWFNNSFKRIADKTTVSDVANNFFTVPYTLENTLEWLNQFFNFFRNNNNGDLIKSQKVFPNQQLSLCKLDSLRYDKNIPEEFKDLANYAGNPNSPKDVYRHQLLHPSILGYEQHHPLQLEEVYKYIKKEFDDSNETTKEIIARHTIEILVKSENIEPEEKKLYDFAKTVSKYPLEEPKYIKTSSGFNWGFAQEYYIKLICNRIAQSVNTEGFKSLSSSLKGKSDKEIAEWIDSLIIFLHSYKNKKYWRIITDKDNGIGIWLNQNNNFCKFQDVRRDEDIPEPLKELTVNNRHLNRDYREFLFTLNSSNTHLLETQPVTIDEVAKFIDDKLKSYDGNKQDNDFRSLVFELIKLCKSISGLEHMMGYFENSKSSLVVWSLGEGETMNMVGAIVQQGDEKVKAAKELIERNSLDDLNRLIENQTLINQVVQQDKGQLTAINDLLRNFNIDFQDLLKKLKNEQGEFNTDSFEQAITDARKREIGDKGECYVYELLCQKFDKSQIKWSNYAPNDDNARIVKFNNHEYRLITTYHDFDFEVSANNGKTYYIEVKTTIGSIKKSTNFPLIFQPKEWEWIDNNCTSDALHYIVRVFAVESNPKAYFLKQELNVE